MKKLMTLVLMMFTIMFTVSAQGADEAAAADDSLKIGISKLMAHPALDSRHRMQTGRSVLQLQ